MSYTATRSPVTALPPGAEVLDADPDEPLITLFRRLAAADRVLVAIDGCRIIHAPMEPICPT